MRPTRSVMRDFVHVNGAADLDLKAVPAQRGAQPYSPCRAALLRLTLQSGARRSCHRGLPERSPPGGDRCASPTAHRRHWASSASSDAIAHQIYRSVPLQPCSPHRDRACSNRRCACALRQARACVCIWACVRPDVSGSRSVSVRLEPCVLTVAISMV